MKKLLALALSLVMILSLAACGKETPTTEAPTTAAPTTAAPTTAEPTTEAVPEVKVLSYEEYLAAANDSEVAVEACVQFAAYNKEYGTVSLFLADEDGAYFVYRMNVTPEEAALLTEGTMIRVKGFKTEWSGEVEFAEGSASFEVVEGAESYVAKAKDVTALFGKDELIGCMNQKISVKGAVVEASKDADGKEAAFLYKWNGSGVDGDDLYFNVGVGGRTYTLTVESDEWGAGTDVYEAVKNLNVGDEINLEGFLYWYEGPQPHVSAVTPVMNYEQFNAAENDTRAAIKGYVQFAAYNETYGTVSLFLADEDGAYFVYRMNVTPEEAALLTEGTLINVEGFKSEWSGEVEFAEGSASFTVVEGAESYVAKAKDVTALFGKDELIDYMNQKISVKGAVVEASKDADGKEAAFLYKWNGSGADGDDLYFNVGVGGQTYTLTVESDEWGAGTDVYEAVKNLNVGDEINLEGFLYWYEGPQPHVSAVTPVMNYEQFGAAEMDTKAAVKAYVQFAAYNKDYGTVSLFLADKDGAYFVYRMNVTPEEAALLTEGTLINVEGFKSEWSGEVEFAEGSASFAVVEGAESYVAEAKDVTALFGKDELIDYMNQKISVKGAVVEASKDADGKEAAFLYKWNGSGVDGDDLYFNVSVDGQTYTLTVESDEWGAGTDVYEAVKNLSVGNKIDLEGFLYWYEGPQPHVSAVK